MLVGLDCRRERRVGWEGSGGGRRKMEIKRLWRRGIMCFLCMCE